MSRSHIATGGSGTLDSILLAIADDKTGPTMWMDRKTGKIFAPYDGGFDVVASP
ncbi:DUF3885 domain-containing protein [Rhizobium ruizarguesonis]